MNHFLAIKDRFSTEFRAKLISLLIGSILFIWLIFPKLSFGEDISLEGGDATISDSSITAYDHLLANIQDAKSKSKHENGKIGFDRNFGRIQINGKVRLGPQFNNVSCSGCHINNGRGTPTFSKNSSQSVIKISSPTGNPSVPNGPVPLRKFGIQLHDHAIHGIKPDAHIKIMWELFEDRYTDGTPFVLRKPITQIILPNKKNLPFGTFISLRRTPPVYGTGLLESIEDMTIESLADENDSNQDGISGRPNMVWNLKNKKMSVGKFGFKAGSPSIIQQVATAYAIDMGVTNPLVRLNDRKPDISQRILNSSTFYTRTLAVPKSRSIDPVKESAGQSLFSSLHCNSCHVMTLVTGNSDIPELSHQLIHPFTDLLLHDMGEGLADNRPEFKASGREWRTSPLWGIGLTKEVLGGENENFLHDGRAKSLEEAILWHGGEAKNSSDAFKALSKEDRDSLVSFLHSL